VKWSIVLAALFVQFPLMILFPAWLAWRTKKKTGLVWNVWGLGALAFIASQIVHLPLNWAIGLLGAPKGLALAPYPVYAASVGLSAGLCEELARYLVLRKWLPRSQDDRASLLFGAGHGGVESIIFGVLAGAGTLNMLLLSILPAKALGLTPETAREAYGAAIGYWASSPVTNVLAGLERLTAIAFHVMATHMVMRAVARRRIGWLLLAIASHAALDGAAVAASKLLGTYATSAIFFVVGIVCVAVTVQLRRTPAQGAGAPSS
jgi:uncharacterized membrane protein YhfC